MHSSDWQPTATLEMLRRRADVLFKFREFFQKRGVLEVETPALSHFANPDPSIESFSTEPCLDFPHRLYLHTSPEFPMKRLLAAGAGAIYQICKVFRREPFSKRHNPEFTMLEWYRPGYDYFSLMDEVAELVELFFGTRSEKLTYDEVFFTHTGLRIHVANKQHLKEFIFDRGISVSETLNDLDIQGWRDLVFATVIEPKLGYSSPVLIYDFPREAASLARMRHDSPHLAERFELFIDGYEIANGYTELIDEAEQYQRWQQFLTRREQNQQELNPLDHRMMSALGNGMSTVSGVALGVDRFLMCLHSATRIEEVLAFPIDIA